MATPAQIIRSCLIDGGLVVMPVDGLTQLPDDGNPPFCFVNSTPDEIDNIVVIRNVGGSFQGKRMEDSKPLCNPGISILIRHLEDDAGGTLANSIATFLDKIDARQTTIPEDDSVHYIQNVSRKTPVICLGEQSGNKRMQWSFNCEVNFQETEPNIG